MFLLDYIPEIVVLVVLLVLILKCLKVVGQYERGVVLTLGKFSHVAEPGLNLLVPFVQQMIRTDVRINAMAVAPQDVITSDNVSVKVAAVAYFQVQDAEKALLGVRDYREAIAQMAQITLRSTIGSHTLDELLTRQDKLNDTLSKVIEERSRQWGIRVDHVEIRSVDLDPSMIRAMAQEAEAERGRRARKITAEGEFEAARKLGEAADILAKNPAAITLRTLATLKEIGAEQNSVIIFPVAQETLLPGTSALGGAAVAKAMGDIMARTGHDGASKDAKGDGGHTVRDALPHD